MPRVSVSELAEKCAEADIPPPFLLDIGTNPTRLAQGIAYLMGTFSKVNPRLSLGDYISYEIKKAKGNRKP